MPTVNHLDGLRLKISDRRAVAELRDRLLEQFPVEALVLYGSAVRGDADDESDVDLLVVTSHPLSRWERHAITDAAFEINLRYQTNLSTLVVDRAAWEEGPLSVLPLREEITREGVPL